MNNKHLGICPCCKTEVMPKIIEEKMIRDLCECPECNAKIMVCCTPGCQNYAQSGKILNNDFCPSCISEAPKAIGAALLGAATLATSIITILDYKNKE